MGHPVKKARTAEEVKADFQRRGVPISRWAIENGLQPKTVFHLLSGRSPALRGDAHKAAVLLGMKDGVIE